MDVGDHIRAWSYRRQRLDRAGGDTLAVIRAVTAVYATQPTAILSLAARVAALDPADFRRLDEDEVTV